MTRWKLRIAGGLTLFSLLALSPPPSHAGWRTKAEKRPKAVPTDCEFGYYGTKWRAWPEGCKEWPGCANSALPFATPFAPPAMSYPQPAMSYPTAAPTWPQTTWPAPPASAPPFASPVPAATTPSPWSGYREYLPPEKVTPMTPNFTPPDAQPPTPIPHSQPLPPIPNSSRLQVPPLPTTRMPPLTNTVQPASAAIRQNSPSSVVTLGTPQADTQQPPPLLSPDRSAPPPTYSSVPKSLITPRDESVSRPARRQNPVQLLSIE